MRKKLLSAAAILVAVPAWHSVALLAILAFVWLVAMTTPANTAKTQSLDQRMAFCEGRIVTLEQGSFANVPGVGQVTMTGTGGPYTLHVGALANFVGGGNTAFLAGLNGPGPSQSLGTNSSGSPDGNSGTAWGTGERNYINGLWASVNGIINVLRNSGFIN